MKVKNIILFISSVGLSLILLEIGLRVFTLFPIHPPLANRVYDERLGYRLKPFSKEGDQNGFRNEKALKQADIVTLGDSQTFGDNVSREDSWPQQLALMTNRSVYNFGIGGYGSLQYCYLIDEVIKLCPRHIILGLYVVNDLDDTCNLMNQLEFWQNWAKERGFNIEVGRNFKQPVPPVHETDRLTGFTGRMWDGIRPVLTQTAIGSLIVYYAQISLIQQPNPNDTVIINEEVNKTIIKHTRISAHKRYTDLTQTDIALAFEITKTILYEAKRKADNKNIQFSVVFIPSKENVFFEYLIDKGYQLPKDYYASISNERALVERFSVFLREIGVRYVDARSYVVQELYKTENVYSTSDDGHPSKVGYKAYAKAVYENLFK